MPKKKSLDLFSHEELTLWGILEISKNKFRNLERDDEE